MRAGNRVVGAKGFEPSTSWSRTRRASQAALRPDCFDLTTASESSDEGHRPSRSDSGRASQAALRPDCFDPTTASESSDESHRPSRSDQGALARLRYAPTALILPLLQKVQTRAIDLPDPIGTR